MNRKTIEFTMKNCDSRCIGMLKIIICEDDPRFLNYLYNKIKDYFKEMDIIKYDINCFNSVEELIKTNVQNINIIFLDVQFQSMNGIEAAKILRKQSKEFILVFVTAFIKYAPAGYKVNAFRYILKEQAEKTLEETLKESLIMLDLYKNQVTFKFIGFDFPIKVYTNNIIYIESELHKVKFRLVDSDEYLRIYEKLDTIEKELPVEEFVRIHQSYLVNLQYIINAKNYIAQLKYNIELPISQKLFPSVKNKLFLYKGRI